MITLRDAVIHPLIPVEPHVLLGAKGLSLSLILTILVLDFFWFLTFLLQSLFLCGLSTALRDAAEGGNPVFWRAAGDKWVCQQWAPGHLYSVPDPVHHSC